jgi:signal transduction histidine kinase
MIRPQRTDALIGLAFAAAAAVEVWIVPAGTTLEMLLAALVCLPVGWRRAAPAGALLAAAAVMAVISVTAASLENSLPIAAFVLLMFSLAARADRAWRVSAIAAAIVVAGIVVETRGDAFPDVLFVGVMFLGLPYFAGRLLHSRTALVARLAEQARLLDAEREAQAARAAADERTRMAAELHDLVAAGVREMLAEVAVAEAAAAGEPDRSVQAIGAVETRGRDTLVEMRRLLGVLRREDEELALAPQPSLDRLEELARIVARDGVSATVRVEGTAHELSPGVDVAAYRIVEEALGTATPGARAGVTVRWHRTSVELEVAVDGSAPPRGDALAATRERVSLFGGRLRIARRPDGGRTLVAELPTREREAVT